MEAMNNQNKQIVPGTALCGGYYVGSFKISDQTYLLIDAGKAGDISGPWGNMSLIENARSFVDGFANTKAMAEDGSKIAQEVRMLKINGFSDWFIPARNQLEMMYRNLKPTIQQNFCSYLDGHNAHSLPAGQLYTGEYPSQTQAQHYKDNGPEAFSNEWYWSSTQASENKAFMQYFFDGIQNYYRKSNELRVRAVRMVNAAGTINKIAEAA